MEGLERIKILSSEIQCNATKKIVEYLLLREDMNEKYLNEKKSLKQMIQFIQLEARKKATNNMAYLTDEEVYSLAIHYWDEPNEKLDLNNSIVKTTVNKSNSKSQVSKSTKKTIIKSEGQISIFDVI